MCSHDLQAVNINAFMSFLNVYQKRKKKRKSTNMSDAKYVLCTKCLHAYRSCQKNADMHALNNIQNMTGQSNIYILIISLVTNL